MGIDILSGFGWKQNKCYSDYYNIRQGVLAIDILLECIEVYKIISQGIKQTRQIRIKIQCTCFSLNHIVSGFPTAGGFPGYLIKGMTNKTKHMANDKKTAFFLSLVNGIALWQNI